MIHHKKNLIELSAAASLITSCVCLVNPSSGLDFCRSLPLSGRIAGAALLYGALGVIGETCALIHKGITNFLVHTWLGSSERTDIDGAVRLHTDAIVHEASKTASTLSTVLLSTAIIGTAACCLQHKQ